MSFLKKYKPTYYNDFIIEKEYINLLNILQKMDNLNILFIGEQGVGKTSLIMATINEYYKSHNISKYDILKYCVIYNISKYHILKYCKSHNISKYHILKYCVIYKQFERTGYKLLS